MTGADDRFDAPTDEELDELLAALALDALDDDERARVDEILTDSDSLATGARADADRYALAADWLADAVEPVEPPAALWDQIAAQLDAPAQPSSVESDAPVAPTAAASASPVAARTVPRTAQPTETDQPPVDELAARRARRDGWTPITTLVSVAAAVILVLVISGAALVVSRDGSGTTKDLAAAAQSAATQPGARVADLTPTEYGPGMHAQVVVAPDGQTYFVGDGLPSLEADQAYQLWSVNDAGDAVSVGVLGSDPQVAMLSMGTDPGLLAVTVEPAAGSVAATTNPLVAGKLA